MFKFWITVCFWILHIIEPACGLSASGHLPLLHNTGPFLYLFRSDPIHLNPAGWTASFWMKSFTRGPNNNSSYCTFELSCGGIERNAVAKVALTNPLTQHDNAVTGAQMQPIMVHDWTHLSFIGLVANRTHSLSSAWSLSVVVNGTEIGHTALLPHQQCTKGYGLRLLLGDDAKALDVLTIAPRLWSKALSSTEAVQLFARESERGIEFVRAAVDSAVELLTSTGSPLVPAAQSDTSSFGYSDPASFQVSASENFYDENGILHPDTLRDLGTVPVLDAEMEDAKHRLATLLESARCGPAACYDPVQQRELYAQAARLGSAEGLHRWALMTGFGADGAVCARCEHHFAEDLVVSSLPLITDHDRNEALHALLASAEMGNAPALASLSVMLSTMTPSCLLDALQAPPSNTITVPLPADHIASSGTLREALLHHVRARCPEGEVPALGVDLGLHAAAAVRFSRTPRALLQHHSDLVDRLQAFSNQPRRDARMLGPLTEEEYVQHRVRAVSLGLLQVAAAHADAPNDNNEISDFPDFSLEQYRDEQRRLLSELFLEEKSGAADIRLFQPSTDDDASLVHPGAAMPMAKSPAPTHRPSAAPSAKPTVMPTNPTSLPSSRPSAQPSSRPSVPSSQPSGVPTCGPSREPTRQPTRQPSAQPSRAPSSQPSRQPSRQPTGQPTRAPSSQPSRQPSRQPTGQPSRQPTRQPSSVPSALPTSKPSIPTSQPSSSPTSPTSQPSRQPTSVPSGAPITFTLPITRIEDDIVAPLVANCYPDPTPLCNLRSAWQVCGSSYLRSIDTCLIMLPPSTVLPLNASLGQLVMSYAHHVVLQGNQSTIALQGRDSRLFYYLETTIGDYPPPSLSVFNTTLAQFGGSALNGGVGYVQGNLKLTIANSTVANNTGSLGGAFYVRYLAQPVTVTDSLFANNSATNGGAWYLFSNMTSVNFNRTVFQNCSVTGVGGAIVLGRYNSGVRISYSNFTSCRASSTTSAGGSLYLYSYNSAIEVYNCLFYNSTTAVTATANSGGGMYIGTYNANINVTRSVFWNATAFYGGGVYMGSSNSNITFEASAFIGNAAKNSQQTGGAIYMAANCKGITVDRTAFTNTGNIYADGSSNFTVSNSMFANQTARNGGAVSITNSNYFAFFNNTARNCSATNGGVLYLDSNVNITLSNNTFSNCRVNSGAGGAIMLSTFNQYVAIVNSTFQTCYAFNANGYGGAIYANYFNRNVSLMDLAITNTSASVNGGAIFLNANNYNASMVNLAITNSTLFCAAMSGVCAGGAIAASSANNNLTLVNITIRDSLARRVVATSTASTYGGAIVLGSSNTYAYIGNINLINVATGTFGGGICSLTSNNFLTMRNITISIAKASNGGALFIYQTHTNVNISGLTVTNSSSTVVGGGGGALYFVFKNSNVSLVDVALRNCSASLGGGILVGNNQASFLLRNVSIANTFTTSSTGTGGAILVQSNVTNVVNQNLTIVNVSSVGAYFMSMNNRNFTFLDVSFDNCTSQYQYGAALNIQNQNWGIVVARSNFTRCYAKKGASAVYIGNRNRRVVLTENRFENCASASGPGGAIQIEAGTLDVAITNSTFSHTQASTGGAICINGTTNVLIQNVIMSSTVANLTGGAIAIMLNNYNVTVTNVSVADSYAGLQAGALVIMSGNQFVTIDKFTADRSGTVVNGGAILVTSNNPNLVIRNSTITNSYTSSGEISAGGGIYMFGNNDDALLENVRMVNCTSYSGGGLRLVTYNKNVTVRNCLIQGCHATMDGGGLNLYNYNTGVSVIGTTIANCTAAGRGGGVSMDSDNSNITLINVEIMQCASSTVGGGVWLGESNTDVTILASRLVGNRAVNGGAVYGENGNHELTIAGSNLTHNEATLSGGGIYLQESHGQTAIIDGEGYQKRAIIQSEHPYQDYIPVNGVRYVIANGTVHVPGALRLVVNFDPQTFFSRGSDIYFYDAAGNVIEAYSTTTPLPGMAAPTLIIPGSYCRVAFLASDRTNVVPITYSRNYYGVKIYFYPVLNETAAPTIIAHNIAWQNGAGMYLYSSNSFGVTVNTVFASNRASSGAGLYFRVTNFGAVMQKVTFAENVADGYGGGLQLFAGQYAVTVQDSKFHANIAGTAGGAVGLKTGNGAGLLSYGNTVNFVGCTLIANSAGIGGGVYLNDENQLAVSGGIISHNSATTGSGGAIYANTDNTVAITDTAAVLNTAALCGGAVATVSNNTLAMSDVNMTSNSAVSGGALCATSASALHLSGTSQFRGNAARTTGGWLALSNSPLWSLADGGHITVQENTAARGSAAFIYNLAASNDSMHDVAFVENAASVGGTVYWIYDAAFSYRRLETSDSVPGEPAGMNDPSNSWVGNQAPYGGEGGTQAVTLVGPVVYDVNVYSQAVTPPISITMLDFYGDFMPLNGDTYVTVTIPDTSSAQCFGQYPHLSGSDLLGVPMSNGVVLFSDLEVFCAPNGNMTVRFASNPGNLVGALASTTSAQYAISVDVLLKFRGCGVGEINSKGACTVCPNGTYSFTENSYECASCVGIEGVDHCYGSEIVLREGYWRSSPTATAVLPCLLDPSSCVGGDAAGSQSCAAGYESALCSVCAEGYFLNEYVCDSCASGSVMSPVLILLLLLAGAFLVVASVVIFYRYINVPEPGADTDRQSSFSAQLPPSQIPSASAPPAAALTYWQLTYLWLKMKYAEYIVKIKIIVATVQVVSATSLVFDVSLPRSFEAFTSTFDILQLSFATMFPLNCTQRFNFMDTLLLTTLFPICAAALLVLAFMAEYVYQGNKIQANPHRRRGEKLEMFNFVKNKYLNYMFYLSYLVLPSVTSTIFQIFICTDVDPKNERISGDRYYLTADTSISCQSAYYHSWTGYAYFMILVYPVGIPAVYLYLLYRRRDEISSRDVEVDVPTADTAVTAMPSPDQSIAVAGKIEEPHSQSILPPILFRDSTVDDERPSIMRRDVLTAETERLSFLWSSYKPEFWYWEVVESTRRIVLTAVLSVCGPGTSQQNVLSLLLALLYIKLYGYFSPYVDPLAGILAETGQFQIFFTFFGAMVIQNSLLNSSWDAFLGGILVVINLVIIAVTFQGELQAYWEESRKAAEEKAATAESGKSTPPEQSNSDRSSPTPTTSASSGAPPRARRQSAGDLRADAAYREAAARYASEHPHGANTTTGDRRGRPGAEVEMSEMTGTAGVAKGMGARSGDATKAGLEGHAERASEVSASDVYDVEALSTQRNPLRGV